MPKITRAEDLFWPTPGHPVETIANLDAIPIAECGEEMVELKSACPTIDILPMGPFGRTGNSSLWSRRSVADRLNQVQQEIVARRPEVRLVVVDAWRSPSRQTRMHHMARFIFRCRYPGLSAALIREAANKYVAAPDAIAPPPHSTGGAVDVRLYDVSRKRHLPMGSASRTDHDGVTGTARENRVFLSEVMNAAGFSNYEEEWWHWSYGDSGWALRTNRETAIFGRTQPPETSGR